MIKTITWVVVLVILVGGGYYALNSDSALEDDMGMNQNQEESIEEQSSQNTEGKKMAFSEFLKQGGSYKCTVDQYITAGDYENITKGTTYVSGGMVRGEYTSKVENLNVESTVLVRDGYTYSWTSMAPNMGFKVKVVEAKGDTSTSTSGSYNWNAEQIGDYECVPWTVDMSKFAVPTDITFQELNK